VVRLLVLEFTKNWLKWPVTTAKWLTTNMQENTKRTIEKKIKKN